MASRVRLTADVDPDVKKRVKLAAIESDTSVSEWIEEALRERLRQSESGESTQGERRYIAPGLSLPPDGAKTRDDSISRKELLKAILADRDGWHMPTPGSKPQGSRNPPRLKDGSKISDAVVEDRR